MNDKAKYIHALVENYYAMNPTEQMNKTLKTAKKAIRAQEEAEAARREFIINIVGKNTFRKVSDPELFAPIPVNALKITRKDFDNMNLSIDDNRTDKFVENIGIRYFRNDFMLRNNGFDDVIKTDIVLKTPDELIDFFYTVLASFKKTYHSEENINWKPIVQKFRHYINQ